MENTQTTSKSPKLKLDFKGIYYIPRIIKKAKLGDAAILKEIIKIFYSLYLRFDFVDVTLCCFVFRDALCFRAKKVLPDVSKIINYLNLAFENLV